MPPVLSVGREDLSERRSQQTKLISIFVSFSHAGTGIFRDRLTRYFLFFSSVCARKQKENEIYFLSVIKCIGSKYPSGRWNIRLGSTFLFVLSHDMDRIACNYFKNITKKGVGHEFRLFALHTYWSFRICAIHNESDNYLVDVDESESKVCKAVNTVSSRSRCSPFYHWIPPTRLFHVLYGSRRFTKFGWWGVGCGDGCGVGKQKALSVHFVKKHWKQRKNAGMHRKHPSLVLHQSVWHVLHHPPRREYKGSLTSDNNYQESLFHVPSTKQDFLNTMSRWSEIRLRGRLELWIPWM